MPSVVQPLWFSLLRQWKASKRGTTGLTLPFLVGVLWMKHSEPGQPLDISVLTSLLDAMRRRTPHGHCVRIGKCTVLGEPVAELDPKTTIIVSERIRLSKGTSALYVGDYPHERDLDSVANYLWTLVGDAILKKHFSFVKGQGYVPFTEGDRAFIDLAKSVRMSCGE